MNHPQKKITSAQAIVECLRLEEITKVFCVPGESYLPVMNAIREEPSIDLVSTRHESGAAFMAEGFAKASGKPGVVMATRGVGASNLTIGVHTAYQDSTPMVVLIGQVHSQFRGREGFQEIDLDRYFSHIAKWTVEVQDPGRVPELTQRAIRIAKSGRPGPVVLSLPEDMLKKTGSMDFRKPSVKPAPRPSSLEIKKMEELLQLAGRPIVIAGGGVKSAEAEEALEAFASKYGLPVLSAFRRQDVYPNHHNLYVGHLGLGTNNHILQTIHEADTVLAIGTRLSEVTTQDYSVLSKDKALIHIDIDYETLGKVYSPDVGVVADAKEALQDLMGINITPRWRMWVEARRQAYMDVLHHQDLSLNRQIISILQKKLPEDTIITNDAGNFAGWLHTYFSFNKKKTYIGPTSGAMGYGLPAAMGAKLAQSSRTVVSLSGDGGFMMTMQEVETAVRYNIPIISIIFNNRMYGTIRMQQEIHFPYKTIGTNLGDVPFSKLAMELGASGFYVQKAKEFEQALTQAITDGKPSVIEVETDPELISPSATIQRIRERSKK